MSQQLSHDQLANNLALHLINDSRMVWEDIPVGKAGSVRPDVLTIEKSFANPNPISYEIKVSVSDFRSDVTAAKWMNYLNFSYGVIFATPKGLISKSDLPKGCGLITFNGEFWNTVKKPTLSRSELNNELLLKLLIAGQERESNIQPIQNRDFDSYKHHETLRKKFGAELRNKIALVESYSEKKKELNSLKKRLGKIFNVDIDRWGFEKDIEYHIKQLEIMADESERKLKIANELLTTKEQLNRDIDRIIESYTKGKSMGKIS